MAWIDGTKRYSPPRLTMWWSGKVMTLFASLGTSPTTSRGTTTVELSNEPMMGLFVTASAKKQGAWILPEQLTPPQVA